MEAAKQPLSCGGDREWEPGSNRGGRWEKRGREAGYPGGELAEMAKISQPRHNISQ